MAYADPVSELKNYVIKNRDLFEDVQNGFNHASGTPRVGEHSILNYPKILDDMIKYVKGFNEYKSSGDNQYKRKVLQSTYSFYNSMFDTRNNKYRKTITISEFPNMNYKFIEKTKDLNKLIMQMKTSVDNQTLNMAKITESQYKKLAKVNHDDMLLYMWLTNDVNCPSNLRAFYGDKSTPVMHKIEKKS